MKKTSSFVCQACGTIYSKWVGKCEACNEWGTVQEEQAASEFSKISANSKSRSSKIEFTSLDSQVLDNQRTSTQIDELDRVLGGGIVEGSAILLGGDPGIGKSTLLLQLALKLSQLGKNVMYISGEESVNQIKLRAARMEKGTNDGRAVHLASSTSVSDIISALKASNPKPELVVIDSIQTMYVDAIESAPGTVSQVRASAHELVQICKKLGICLVLVGHVTKDGQIAGPRVLEHMVDTVLYFEGERGYQFRILRAVKNRFGGIDEIGVFEMGESGLVQVHNPSSLFLSSRAEGISGTAVFAGMEGSRPLLVEVQALVGHSYMSMPRRAVVGWDLNRLAMLLAVLEARADIKFHDKEVYLSVAGGFKINEPAADLAVAAAILSARSDSPLPKDAVFFGEIGLSGEIRPVNRAEQRLKESAKLGFPRAFIPKLSLKSGSKSAIPQADSKGMVNEFENLRNLINFLHF
jgi:DNA repair protein RadA/Sms